MTDENRVKALMHDPERTKPEFITEANVDKLVAVTLRLAMEISVLRDQLDTQRGLLEHHGVLKPGEVEGFKPDAERAAARKSAKEALLANMINDLM